MAGKGGGDARDSLVLDEDQAAFLEPRLLALNVEHRDIAQHQRLTRPDQKRGEHPEQSDDVTREPDVPLPSSLARAGPEKFMARSRAPGQRGAGGQPPRWAGMNSSRTAFAINSSGMTPWLSRKLLNAISSKSSPSASSVSTRSSMSLR